MVDHGAPDPVERRLVRARTHQAAHAHVATIHQWAHPLLHVGRHGHADGVGQSDLVGGVLHHHVDHFVETFGQDRLVQLITAFGEGSGLDGAFLAATGEDYTGFFDVGRVTDITVVAERVLDDAFEDLEGEGLVGLGDLDRAHVADERPPLDRGDGDGDPVALHPLQAPREATSRWDRRRHGSGCRSIPRSCPSSRPWDPST